jgi:hypothetical protein
LKARFSGKVGGKLTKIKLEFNRRKRREHKRGAGQFSSTSENMGAVGAKGSSPSPVSMNRRMSVLISNDLRNLTPHAYSLSPLRGEGAALGNRYYFFGLRHSCAGVQRTARQVCFVGGVRGAGGNRGLPMDLLGFRVSGRIMSIRAAG